MIRLGSFPHANWLLAMQGTDSPQDERSNAELMVVCTPDTFLSRPSAIQESHDMSFVVEMVSMNLVVLVRPIDCGSELTRLMQSTAVTTTQYDWQGLRLPMLILDILA
jgi:hypothetical protein